MSVDYPETRRGDTVDEYHGRAIADPYRWMEDLESPDIRRWIDEQNLVTERYLQTLPLRAHFRDRITALWDYPKVSVPVVEAGRLFYQRNSGLQKQAAIYLREPGLEPVLVLDPNTLSPDGATALMAFAPSPDARLLAYTLAQGGADWQTCTCRYHRADATSTIASAGCDSPSSPGRTTARASSTRGFPSRRPARPSRRRSPTTRSTTTASARRRPRTV